MNSSGARSSLAKFTQFHCAFTNTLRDEEYSEF
jgi:hypothetical protein